MPWKTQDRTEPTNGRPAGPVLSEAVKAKIRSFFDRYETRRAALLPALHVVQDTLGGVDEQAMIEVAELLGLHPSDVLDVTGFYTHIWRGRRGRKVIVVCRSMSCDVMGGGAVFAAIKDHLGIDEGQTTPDGEYSLMTEECLGQCEHAPCVLIGEKRHGPVRPEDVPALLADANNDKLDLPRSDLYDGVKGDASTETSGSQG